MSFRFVTGLTRWARLTVNSAALRRLYRDVLVRCRIGKTRDLAKRRLAHPRPDAVDEASCISHLPTREGYFAPTPANSGVRVWANSSTASASLSPSFSSRAIES